MSPRGGAVGRGPLGLGGGAAQEGAGLSETRACGAVAG